MNPIHEHRPAHNSAVSTLYALYGQEIKKVLKAHSQTAIEMISKANLEPAQFEITRQQTWQDLAHILNTDLKLTTPTTPPVSAPASFPNQAAGVGGMVVDLALAFKAQDFQELTQPQQIIPLVLFVRSRSQPHKSKTTSPS